MRDNWCIHYAGFIRPGMKEVTHCLAGVEYASVSVPDPDRTPQAFKKSFHPCFRYEAAKAKPCDKCHFRTDGEQKTYDDEITAHINSIGVARKAIVDHLSGPWKKGMKGAFGTISCPVCKTGQLSFTRSAYNGHIHAKCTTDDCVSWME
jgi:hypothetical protein